MVSNKFKYWFCVVVSLGVYISKSSLCFAKGGPIYTKTAKAALQVRGEVPFVVVSCSYNNSLYCEKSLLSILNQKYENFRVILIEDCSTDDTGAKIQKVIEQHEKGSKVQLLRNTKNKGAMENQYRAIHSCEPDEVIVIVDGDDFLAHESVLSKLNEYYANFDVWLTYGSYKWYPSGKLNRGLYPLRDSVVQAKGVRGHPWVTTHLRTFYSGLFQRIQLQDLVRNGEFFEAAVDPAAMFPMLEQAKGHAFFVPEYLYLYNIETPLMVNKVKRKAQQSVVNFVQKLPSYEALDVHPGDEFISENERADILIFSRDSHKLRTCLNSVFQNLQGVGKIFAVCGSSEDSLGLYDQILNQFPDVTLFSCSEVSHNQDISKAIFEACSDTEYIIISSDQDMVDSNIDLREVFKLMNQTGAVSFSFSSPFNTAQESVKTIKFESGISAWQFGLEEDWVLYPISTGITLVRMDIIRKALFNLEFLNKNSLHSAILGAFDPRNIGLYSESSKTQS